MLNVQILRGRNHRPENSDINIVIDVIRAFTTSHMAFKRAVRQIYLVNSVDEALALRKKHPHIRIAGEIHALPIEGFDFGNSPHQISQQDLSGLELVLKTTNGVAATLNALGAKHVFVAGFVNARRTAEHVKELALSQGLERIVIIASEPEGDDDLACAEYIRDVILGHNQLKPATVAQRIRDSHAAQKFFDPAKPQFDQRDVELCLIEDKAAFVMPVLDLEIPVIVRT